MKVAEAEEDDGRLHASFLMSAAECINNIPSNALRSHLNIHCSNILNFNDLALSRKGQSDRVMCKYCLTPWQRGLFSMKLRPRVKSGKKMRRILKRIEENKTVTGIQKKLADAYHPGNTIVIKCQTCHKVSTIRSGVNKTTPKTPVMTPTNLVICDSVNTSGKRKKKKKRKNQFCGLKADVVTQIKSSGKKEKNKGRSSFGSDVIDSGDDVITIDSEKVTPPSLKRKLDKAPDVFSLNSAKLKKMKKDDGSIKAKPLKITPLGAKATPLNVKPRSDDFISLEVDSGSGKKGTPERGLFDTPFRSGVKDRKSNGQKMINPFATPCHVKGSKTNSGRKNRWKRLIAEEEKNAVQGTTLKDFLSAL